MPSNVTVTYPNAPWQQPGIVQNMLQMRATSPRPNQYLGGAYNPTYQSNSYRLYDYRPMYYQGYGDPYAWSNSYGSIGLGSGFYGGYGVPSTTYVYSGNGAWGPVYVPQAPVIIQR